VLIVSGPSRPARSCTVRAKWCSAKARSCCAWPCARVPRARRVTRLARARPALVPPPAERRLRPPHRAQAGGPHPRGHQVGPREERRRHPRRAQGGASAPFKDPPGGPCRRTRPAPAWQLPRPRPRRRQPEAPPPPRAAAQVAIVEVLTAKGRSSELKLEVGGGLGGGRWTEVRGARGGPRHAVQGPAGVCCEARADVRVRLAGPAGGCPGGGRERRGQDHHCGQAGGAAGRRGGKGAAAGAAGRAGRRRGWGRALELSRSTLAGAWCGAARRCTWSLPTPSARPPRSSWRSGRGARARRWAHSARVRGRRRSSARWAEGAAAGGGEGRTSSVGREGVEAVGVQPAPQPLRARLAPPSPPPPPPAAPEPGRAPAARVQGPGRRCGRGGGGHGGPAAHGVQVSGMGRLMEELAGCSWLT
jgi:hypothetical protein